MRKFFLLIPLLSFALLANAKEINIAPGTSLAYTVNDADPGDVIVMADGLYPGEDQIKFVKNITIKAAEGATPVVQTTYYCELKSSAKVFIEGITFDGSSTTQQFIRTYDATAGKELHLNKCEFKNYPKDVISGDKAEYTLDSCVVTNCYFHSNNYSPIYFNKSSVEGQQTIYGLIVKNSTFANNDPSKEYRALIDVQSYDRSATDDIEVIVDHCTFYNNTVINYDYSAIRTRIVNRTTVLNCIFAHPSAQDWYATNVWAGSVTNCLAYNFNNGYNAPTKTEANTGNPLFADAANGDFSLAGDWTTTPITLSPARGAATDGSDLGDPRWYSAEILPEVDFTTPYQLTGAKAKLSGNIWYDDVNEYLYYDNKSTNGTAMWKIHAERACVVDVELNMHEGSPTVHKIRIDVLDADGNNVGEFAEAASTLPGTLIIPAEGDYTIILNDDQAWTSAQIDNITLSYIGGAVQNMPGTTNINDAWFSAEGTRADGKIDFPDGSIQDGWVKWNVAFANAGNYNVIVNIDNANGHNYTVALYEDENDNSPIIVSEGGQKSTIGTLELGKMEVPAGNYILKVTNAVQWSDAKLISVKFEYKGGGIVTIPGSIDLNEAILSERAYVDADGLHFADAEQLWLVPEQWAKWNIQAASGMYSFKFDVASTNYGKYVITLSDAQDNVVYTHEYDHEGDGSYTTESILLMNGNYILKMQNLQSYSQGYITSIVATSEDNVLILDDNATDAAYINAVNGENMKIVLNRTFTGGMYNTICLPFTDWMSSVKAIFGDDVELLELSTAELDGNTLNLIFTAPSELGHGRPYLIKPAQDVKNPVWNSRTINASTGYNTKSCTNADFIGSFIASQVPAGEDNLFLGPNNLLYFWEEPTPIKGTRAYFHIKGVPHPSQSIKHAKIITNDQVVTSIDFTKGENNKVMKAIENGQLIIIRNGERFTVQGQRIQ